MIEKREKTYHVGTGQPAFQFVRPKGVASAQIKSYTIQ